MKVLVCGGRDYDDWECVVETLCWHEPEMELLIHGGARGADSLAHKWASLCTPPMPTKVFRADWKKHGKAAGPIRNQQMLDECLPDLVIAFPGGKGTWDMVNRARQAKIEVEQVGPSVQPSDLRK